jgi:hypothetical protein
MLNLMVREITAKIFKVNDYFWLPKMLKVFRV